MASPQQVPQQAPQQAPQKVPPQQQQAAPQQQQQAAPQQQAAALQQVAPPQTRPLLVEAAAAERAPAETAAERRPLRPGGPLLPRASALLVRHPLLVATLD